VNRGERKDAGMGLENPLRGNDLIQLISDWFFDTLAFSLVQRSEVIDSEDSNLVARAMNDRAIFPRVIRGSFISDQPSTRLPVGV
jgi:hypothetical protein